MTDHQNKDLLRETFAAHEHLAPDPADVYAQVQQIAKGYKLRRIGLQAAGGAVLTAGLVAGAIQLPQFLPGNSSSTNISAAAPAPSAIAGIGDESEKALEAYFKAGYGYESALRLAIIWKKDPKDLFAVKSEAGRLLLAGQTLPIKPVPEDTAPVPADPPISKADQKALDKYFKEGYGYDEAEKLAQIWKLKSPYDAKVAAGKKLLAGKDLPVENTPEPPVVIDGFTPAENKAFNAYFNAGYDGNDVARLAKIWKMDPNDFDGVKIAAGKKLLAGKKLPIKP